ncbi:MAG TPA: cytochrome c3 family protein [Geobacteraceae bacterium]|nr:cytochrome c3 family protein [Geobacteraceae bacterium]
MKNAKGCCHRFLLLMVLGTLFMPEVAAGNVVPNSCRDCHGNAQKMAALGYSHFAVTQQEVERQTGMPATCPECHLGNPAKKEKEQAHEGMGRLMLVRKKGLTAETAQRKLPLEIGGNPLLRLRYLVEEDGRKSADPSVNMLLYQDKRRNNLSQDFNFMGKTCGKCHAREFAEFRESTMGRNAKQSRYKSWTDKEHGPHNCGVWFDGNYAAIAANTAVPFSREANDLNQRTCNACHVGCLDCHYNPMGKESGDPKKGMHTFAKTPPPESCYGGGRGQLCHAGPEDRRRGAGYFGGSFSHPEGMAPDAHLAKEIGCLDCHDNTRDNKALGHGMVKRQATCTKCHAGVVKSHAASLHGKLSCEACHIRDVAGYQATFWGPGKLAGTDTPFFKYKEYYGIMKEPILIKDQRGRWIPVKPYPMAALNQKSADFKPGLHWRYRPSLPDLERTDDAWGYVGLFDGLPENNKALLWIQMDKLSHKYGTSRSCDSCHASETGEQRQEVLWDFGDAGALPFNGRHTVIANGEGLFIKGISADEKIDVSEGYKLSSLAPWFYLKEKWRIKGDFSLPVPKDRKAYEALRDDPAQRERERLLHR